MTAAPRGAQADPPRRYLGVDGGGTKTAFVVADTTGRVLGMTRAGGSDYAGQGLAAVEETLRRGIEQCCAQAGIDVADLSGALFGLPGHGEDPGGTVELDRLVSGLLPDGSGRAVNDVVCGWAGSLGLEDGVDVVAGTGSIAYGRRGAAEARAGGWGEILGDEGSGFWIGRRCLAGFARASDGRAPRGPLYESVRTAAGIRERDLEAVPAFSAADHTLRRRVAAFAPLAADAAAAGDEEAQRILAEAGRELALLARVTADRLGFTSGDAVRVSYSGSVFRAHAVLDAFECALRADGRAMTVQAPVADPVFGAVALAARRAGDDLDAAALQRSARLHDRQAGR